MASGAAINHSNMAQQNQSINSFKDLNKVDNASHYDYVMKKAQAVRNILTLGGGDGIDSSGKLM